MFLFYVYCLTEGLNNNKIDTRNSAIMGDNYIEVVDNDDIQAVISIVDSGSFNGDAVKENLKNLDWVREKAYIHENIVEEIMESAPVLPMRFCTVFNNFKDLTGFLEKYYKHIKHLLAIAAKSCEWGIKIFCDMDVLKKSIMETGDIKAEIEAIGQKPKGIAFMLMKRLEEKVDNCILETMNRDVRYIFEQLKIMAEDTIVREIQDEGPEKIKTVLDIAFLVGNSNCRRFQDRIPDLENEYGRTGYTIKCTGPWPIYNFISFNNGDDLKA